MNTCGLFGTPNLFRSLGIVHILRVEDKELGGFSAPTKTRSADRLNSISRTCNQPGFGRTPDVHCGSFLFVSQLDKKQDIVVF